MGLLDEPGFDGLAAAGCLACGSTQLMFRTYVDGRVPFMGGDPVGRITWMYDGEKFIDGVYEVTCAECKHVAFSAQACPRCHAPEGLTRALASPNGWPVPTACSSCDDDQIGYIAFVPARVAYDGSSKRAEKAVTSIESHDDGFHGYRVDCRDCDPVAERTETCPLCDAPGPLRARPAG